MEVPGKAGYSFFGDESIEFVRTPRDYVEKRRKNHGEVFLGRILNKPTIFLTSNAAVQDLLQEKWAHFSLGYNEYGMSQLFEDSVVFMEGDAWGRMRRTLEQVFSHDSLSHSLQHARQIIREYFHQLKTGTPVVVYEIFKVLATQLSIVLFLSHDVSQEDAREISELMTTHWRGIISVPVSVRAPWANWKSGYSKALAAKEQLLAIISERLKSSPSSIASGIRDQCGVDDTVAKHLLLFVSALIPKAFGSILTSVVIELSKPENVGWRDCYGDDARLEDLVLEVQRLWPPFFGGRRICTQECEVGGYCVPKGHSAVYISYWANRDRSVFHDPHLFKPERWSHENVRDREKVWTFGGGPRECIGRHLSVSLLKECVKELLQHYQWELAPGQDLTYKTLPISRPRNDVLATFSPKTSSHLQEPTAPSPQSS